MQKVFQSLGIFPNFKKRLKRCCKLPSTHFKYPGIDDVWPTGSVYWEPGDFLFHLALIGSKWLFQLCIWPVPNRWSNTNFSTYMTSLLAKGVALFLLFCYYAIDEHDIWTRLTWSYIGYISVYVGSEVTVNVSKDMPNITMSLLHSVPIREHWQV